MEEITTKTETNPAVDASIRENNKPEAEEIVLYDECGDTLWDRVLRQEENKIKLSAAPNT
jgi:hypothetical protein